MNTRKTVPTIVIRQYTPAMRARRCAAAFLITVCSLSSAIAADSTADLPKKAIERSQITMPGSHPFVLRAKVIETTNPSSSDYKAEIEEYWVAPDKWQRTIKSSKFSQTLIVNGQKTSELLTGDYYPNWLRTIVAAIFEPGTPLQKIDLSRPADNPMIGGNKDCRRFTYMAGIAPVSNKVFSTVCFENGLLESVGIPGYHASYTKYKDFDGKRVSRAISEYIESGTELEATIDELSELNSIDESRFAIQQPTNLLQTVQVNEATLRGLAVNTPEIIWPATHGGASQGTLSLYVCIGRDGHVREIYELNSSNPGLSDIARDQVLKWEFKTAANHGVPVQVESILTFAFSIGAASPGAAKQ